jgi:hypothetical protein
MRNLIWIFVTGIKLEKLIDCYIILMNHIYFYLYINLEARVFVNKFDVPSVSVHHCIGWFHLTRYKLFK